MDIGRKVRITDATNTDIIGTNGTIIDETKNTITIRTATKDKKIIRTHIITIEETP